MLTFIIAGVLTVVLVGLLHLTTTSAPLAGMCQPVVDHDITSVIEDAVYDFLTAVQAAVGPETVAKCSFSVTTPDPMMYLTIGTEGIWIEYAKDRALCMRSIGLAGKSVNIPVTDEEKMHAFEGDVESPAFLRKALKVPFAV